MFSLIITIISIALVGALAVASIYYGGDAFAQGSEKAGASTLVNQYQQIKGAADLYRVNNMVAATGIDDLTPDFLQNVPDPGQNASGNWEITDGAITVGGVLDSVCTYLTSGGEDPANPPFPSFECDTGTFQAKSAESP